MGFRSNGGEVGVPGGSGKGSAEVEGSWEWTFARVIRILATVMLLVLAGIVALAVWVVYKFISGW